MIAGRDRENLRRLMRVLYDRYGCAAVVGAIFDIGIELDRRAQHIGPPTLAAIIDLADYRRSRRRRDIRPGAA